MTSRKKLNIKGIKKDLYFSDAGHIILSEKLKEVFRLINIFFKDDKPENLHELRIAIRRFRYVMEIFYNCYSYKLFKNVYQQAKSMQDLIGEGRDLDVLEIKIRNISKEYKTEIPKNFYAKIAAEKIGIRQIIKLELIKFMEDKNVNKFILKSNNR